MSTPLMPRRPKPINETGRKLGDLTTESCGPLGQVISRREGLGACCGRSLYYRRLLRPKSSQMPNRCPQVARNPHVVPFAPRIWKENGSTFYEDGRVFGAIDEFEEAGKTGLVIHEWTSHAPGYGHTIEALRWLRDRYGNLTANGIGSIDDEGAADIATAYWEHMRDKGLVDLLILDDGTELAVGRAFP
ncbi:hypothetical protein ACVIGB_000465 [Bradyrhizobium sp. USDA 4341]